MKINNYLMSENNKLSRSKLTGYCHSERPTGVEESHTTMLLSDMRSLHALRLVGMTASPLQETSNKTLKEIKFL